MSLQSVYKERRKLRCDLARARRAIKSHKEKREIIEKANREQRNRIKELEEKIEKLEEENEKMKRQRDRYRDKIFKPNVRNKKETKNKKKEKNKKAGRRKGHKGAGRKSPEKVDKIRRVYLRECPECKEKLKRRNKAQTHIVEDIPKLEKIQTEKIKYEIEEQWCPRCKKRVRARIYEVIPRSRLGINVLLYVMIEKYICKSSWENIREILRKFFGIKVSAGGLVGMAHRAREWLGEDYKKILEKVRGAPVKHADETQWRVKGINEWLWGFFSKKETYYVIEESRGKGVAEKYLGESHEEDVLVRDDYAAYEKLPIKQQSCWAHLLRVSREEANAGKEEEKELHEHLKEVHGRLQDIIREPYEEKTRRENYERYIAELEEIIERKYEGKGAKKIQKRIKHQGGNLLTAIINKGVPLTNNLAERCIRPFVIVRKISGGSRSKQGAETQAVNMSVMQTIKMQDLPLISTLKEKLLSGCYNSG